jgi:hypothetical protein
MAADGSIVFRVDADDKDAQKKLSQLRREMEKTAKAMDSNTGKHNAIVQQLEEARAAAQKTAAEIQEIREQIVENESVLSGKTGDVDIEEFLARKQAQGELTYELAEQEKLLQQQQATVSNLEGQEERIRATLEQQTAQLQQQRDEAGAVERTLANQSSNILPQLRAATDAVTRSMRQGVKSILRWGFGIRSAFILMRRLRSTVIEGVKAFAEQDEETKKNINSLKSALSTLKVSWGAAFAPILNAVTPMLQKLISWLTAAANAVAMFFAVLGGKSTYKRAVAGNEALADSYAGAGAAAKDAQKQLMGFDKINKLNDNDSNSGGGAGAGAKQQYEDVAVNPKTVEFLEKVKEHLREVLIIAGLVTATLLAWKISSLLGVSFTTVLGILMTILGTIIFIKEGFDAWENGVNWDNLTGMIEGAALAVVGLGLAFGTTGAAIGLIVAGVAMLVIGLKDWIKTGKLSTQTFTLLTTAVLALGVGLSLLTGSWIPLLIAVIAAVALACYKYWDQIKAWWNANVQPKIDGAIDRVKQSWERFKESLANLRDSVEKRFSDIREKISSTWENVVQKTTELKQKITQKWAEIRTGISTKISSIRSDLSSGFTQAKNTVIQKFDDMWTGIKTKWENIKSTISTKISQIKGLLNFSWSFPKPKMPHFSWTWQDVGGLFSIPNLSVQWYGKGGVFDTASLIGVGEQGKEAVVPLERNTEWINGLADSLMERMAGNRYADYITGRPLPAFASGQVVPPRAVDRESLFTDEDMKRLAAAFASVLGGSGGQHVTKLVADGRELAEVVEPYFNRFERSRGTR